MYRIALDQYGSTNPTLYFALQHPLLVKAGEPVAECGPGGAGVAAVAAAEEPEAEAEATDEQQPPVSAEEEQPAAEAEEAPAPEEEGEPRLTLDPKAAEEALAAQRAAEEEEARDAALAAAEASPADGGAQVDAAEAEEAEAPAAEVEDAVAAAAAAASSSADAPKSTRRRRLLAPSADAKPATTAAPAKPAPAKAAPVAATAAATGANLDEPADAIAVRAAPPVVTVLQPPKYTASYSLDEGPWGPVANSDGQTTFSPSDPNQKSPMVGVPAQLQDGEHCLRLKATLLAGSGRLSTGEAVPKQDQQVETTACFFRQSRQANATFAFDMCDASSGLIVNVTDITPPPLNLTSNGSAEALDGAQLLLQPLIKVWGKKVRNIDGTPSDGGYDQGAQQGATSFIKYKAVPPPAAAPVEEEGDNGNGTATSGGASISIPIDEAGKRMDEGYFRVSAVVSLLTEVPSLVDLNGLTQIKQRDQASQEGSVSGKWEAKSNMVLDDVLVGVQRSNTTLSAITSASHGPRDTVTAGQEIVLTWQFAGVGTANCTHDGAPLSNTEDGAHCKSPLAFPAAEELGKGKEHRVVVVFADVCGGEKKAEFLYSSKGVVALTKPDPLGTAGGMGGEGDLGRSGLRLKSGAGAAVVAKGALGAALATAAALVM